MVSSKLSTKKTNPGTPHICKMPPIILPPPPPPTITGTWYIDPPILECAPETAQTVIVYGDCDQVEDGLEVETLYELAGYSLEGPNPTLDAQEFNFDFESPAEPADHLLSIRWIYPGLGSHEETSIIRVL